MLVRATRGRRFLPISQNLLNSYNQLQLPWLCPAVDKHACQNRNSSDSTSQRGASQRSSSRSPTRSASIRTSARQLATLADAYSGVEDYIPWQDLSSDQQKLAAKGDGLSNIKPFDTDQLVTISTTRHAAPPVFKRPAMSTITGDISDLLPNLHACVQVGRMDRAAKLIRRMAQIFDPTAPELMDAHHQYLTGLLHTHLEVRSKETFADLKRWFEIDVKGRGVVPDSRIFSIMIKASFAVLEGSHLERTLRRYVEMAALSGPEVKEDTMSSEILTDPEWATLLRLFPQEYEPPTIDTTDPATTSRTEEKSRSDILDLSKPDLSTDPSTLMLPELKGTEQKGIGLKGLRQSLASMYSVEEGLEIDGNRTREVARWRQERLEKDVLQASIERWREEAEHTQAMRARGQLSDPLLGSYVYEWVQEMAEAVKQEIDLATAAEEKPERSAHSEDFDRLLIGPFLRFSDPIKMSAAAVLAFIGSAHDLKGPRGPDKSLVTFVTRVGNAVSQEIRLESIKSDILEKLKTLPSLERRRRLAKLLRQKPQKSTMEGDEELTPSGPSESIGVEAPVAIRAKLGAFFLSLLMKIGRLPVMKTDPTTGEKNTQVQPIATHSWMWRRGKRTGIIRVNPELMTRMKKEPVGSFIAKFLPMLIEPGKWKSMRQGPYLITDISAVRFRDSSHSQQEYLRIADKRGDLKQVYAGLDVIGKVPWKVNRPLLKVLSDAWNSGEQIGKIAPEEPKPDYPPMPDAADIPAYRRWKSLVKTIENEISGFHSQRCYQNFQLEVAKAYANEKAFYCPHNIDFRGRAYPIPPYFNHMCADSVRALFLFANGKELGEIGLRWLKIHLANAYGYDKERLIDREAFTMDHLAEIYDSASNPLDGKRWWLTAGHPWQCLAACMELKAALDSPIPSKYVSHLPVQQDGTCNGLQHYAALGGDIVGAKQVNLVPGDKPADIYSAVADVVKEEIRKAAANGNKIAQHLEGKITRKVVKQPVMTNVYGVTFHGAKEQVKKQLFEILPKGTIDNAIHIGGASAYVAGLIFAALGEMFNGAQAIQQWLGECGGRISQAVTPEQIERIKAHRNNAEPLPKHKKKQIKNMARDSAKEDYQFKSTIVWTTPLGLPVVQPYRSATLKTIKTSLQNLSFEEPSLSDPVSKRRQLQAFPPNFIHSLDSSHMMLSALKCDELGLTFASVHDSFWTHAADVPFMNRVLRDAFVRMHSEDIIGRLREEFIARYKGCFNYAPIQSNSALAKKITKLRRDKGVGRTGFLRPSVREGVQIDELMIEYERMQLLQSDDPEEQKRGREMVTPGSLFEADPNAALLPITNETDVQLLGHKTDAPTTGEGNDEVPIDVPGLDDAEYVAEGSEMSAAPDDDASETSTFTTEIPLSAADDSMDTQAIEDLETEEAEAEEQVSQPTVTEEDKSSKKKQRTSTKLFLWMPIKFPPAPKKGEFDVTTLKDSQYFFS